MPSSFQICKEVKKPCCGRGPGWLSSSDECLKFIFFSSSYLNLNKYCLGVERAPANQVIKSSKWIICESTCCIPLHAATATKCDERKTKGGCWLLKFCLHTQESNKHLLEISCKNKLLIKSYSTWKYRNKLLDISSVIIIPFFFLIFQLIWQWYC